MKNRNTDLAVIGCGYWGKNLVRVFAQLGALRMVCDADPQCRQMATKLAPGAEVVADIEAVFASDVSAIVLATPAETHYQLALGALEAGKDLFVEKPLALTYEEGAALVRMAKRKERILMVGHVLEYHPAIVRLLELVRTGELGKVRYIYSNRLSLGKVRREENILWRFAPHDIAVTLRILNAMPYQVVSCGGNYVQPNIADVTVTNLLFDNGVRAHIFVSWLHPFKEQRLVVVGSRRMASYDDVAKKLILHDQHVEVTNGFPHPIKGEGAEVSFSRKEPLMLEGEAFLQAIESRRPALTDGESALRVLKVLQEAQRSLITNGAIVNLFSEAVA